MSEGRVTETEIKTDVYLRLKKNVINITHLISHRLSNSFHERARCDTTRLRNLKTVKIRKMRK